MKFQGVVKDSKFIPDNRQLLVEYFGTLEKEKIVVDIKKWRQIKKRTVKQNAYYWWMISLLTSTTGYTKEELHCSFKIMFLPKEIRLGRRELITIQSTTELDTLQFINYTEKIRSFAENEIGVNIPLPNEAPIEELEKFYNLL